MIPRSSTLSPLLRNVVIARAIVAPVEGREGLARFVATRDACLRSAHETLRVRRLSREEAAEVDQIVAAVLRMPVPVASFEADPLSRFPFVAAAVERSASAYQAPEPFEAFETFASADPTIPDSVDRVELAEPMSRAASSLSTFVTRVERSLVTLWDTVTGKASALPRPGTVHVEAS